MPSFHTYVALGDSFTEGVGDPDPDPTRPNGVRGWADRVAEGDEAVEGHPTIVQTRWYAARRP